MLPSLCVCFPWPPSGWLWSVEDNAAWRKTRSPPCLPFTCCCGIHTRSLLMQVGTLYSSLGRSGGEGIQRDKPYHLKHNPSCLLFLSLPASTSCFCSFLLPVFCFHPPPHPYPRKMLSATIQSKQRTSGAELLPDPSPVHTHWLPW